MSGRERAKGARGQLAVRRLFEAHGWTVTATGTGLGSRGACDLIATRDGMTLAIEVKNCATLRLPAWRRQTVAFAPAGMLPVLVYKDGRGVWECEWFTESGWRDALAVSLARYPDEYRELEADYEGTTDTGAYEALRRRELELADVTTW